MGRSLAGTRRAGFLVILVALTTLTPLVDHPLHVFASRSSSTTSLNGTSHDTGLAAHLRLSATAAVTVSPAVPPVSYASAVNADNPIVYYRLDDAGCCTAVDSSGHGTNGNYSTTAGITYRVPGLLTGDPDTAISTGGMATAVTASDATLPSGSASRTFEVWEQTTSTGWQSFAQYGQGVGGQLFEMSERGGGQLVYDGASGINAAFTTPYPLNDGNPHYLAITYAGTITAYVDGQQIGQAGLPSPLSTPLGAGLQVGGGFDGPFRGTLDEFSIYASALSPTQINAHWRAGVAVGCPATPTTGYAGVVAGDSPLRQFRFGETSGRAALDFSSNCRAAAYNYGATHVSGLLTGDSDGAVGSPTPAGTIVNASADGLPIHARSVEFWEQTTGNPWQSFLSYGFGNGGQYFMVSTRGNNLLDVIGYNDDAQFTTPYPLNDGVPHYVAVTYDGGQLVTVYLDGQQIGQSGIPSPWTTALGAQGLEIGNGIDGPFHGTLDELAIYNNVLTPTQINTHFQAGVAAAACPATQTTGYAGTVAIDQPLRYWRLGEASGVAALDYSGNCVDAAYAPGAAHVAGLLLNDSDGAVGNPTPPGTIVSASADGLPVHARSVEFWEQTTGNPWQSFLSYGFGNGGQYFMVSTRGNNLLDVIGYKDDAQFTTPYPLNDGVPHYVAVTYDGGQSVTVYLDGQQIGQSGIPSPWTTALGAQGLEIGNGIDGPFHGTLDEVAVYNTPLTGNQVFNHWQAGVTGPGSYLTGRVLTNVSGSLASVQGAKVQACPTNGGTCTVTPVGTNSYGLFGLSVAPGSYTVTAYPTLALSGFGPQTAGPFIALAGSAVAGINLAFLTPIPAGGTFTSPSFGSQSNTTPSVNAGEPATYATTGCKGGYGLLTIQAINTTTGQTETRYAALVETPAGSGNYFAQIPPLAPLHGVANMTSRIVCPGHSPLVPDGGSPSGGNQVAIAGTGFTGATNVLFGTASATAFKVVNDSVIIATSPAGTGVVPVAVILSNGTSESIGNFNYFGVTSLTPNTGPSAGGTTVVIQGVGFNNVKGVLFGLTPATSITVVGPTEIDAVAPPGYGTVDVQVLNGFALSDAVTASLYTYQSLGIVPPSVSGMNEGTGPQAPQTIGQQIANNCNDPSAKQYLTPKVCETARTMINAFGPDAILKSAAVAAILFAGAAILFLAGASAAIFLICAVLCVVAAVIIVFAWDTGLLSKLRIDPSGNIVDTNGNPVAGATVTLLGQSAGGPYTPVPASGGLIDPAVNPETTGASGAFHWDAVAGSYQVQASAPNCNAPGSPGQPNVTTPAFAIPPPVTGLMLSLACPGSSPPTPSITGLSPNYGPRAGGTQVVIEGSGLAGVSAVQFGAATANGIKILSPYALVAIAPPGTSTADITVTNVAGTSAMVQADQFSYIDLPAAAGAPNITSVAPSSGPLTGGTTVTITGSNLGNVFAVFFAGQPASQVFDVSTTQVKAVTPAGMVSGPVAIIAQNGAGYSYSASGYAYQPPPGQAIATTLTLSSSVNPSAFGQPVTFQAAVSSGATGSVQFAVDDGNLGTPAALSNGQATSPAVSSLSVGSHTVTATYAATGPFLASSGTLAQTVSRAATGTTVMSSAGNVLINVPVTFTATVAAVAPGAGTPSGTVQFTSNGSNLGSPVALNNGQASYTMSSLAPGHYAIAAIYGGDPNFAGSTSTSVTQLVRNNLIVFSSTRDGNLQLYLMHADGTVQTRITFNSAQDSEPTLSPDGTHILFVSNRSGYPNIWLMQAAPESSTNVAHNLTNDAAADGDPSWSPDGNHIAFSSARTGRSQLYLMRADGTGLIRLTTDSVDDLNPAWSPDGTRIAYASGATGKLQLYVATLTSSLTFASTTRLITDSSVDAMPAWSPDSKLVAFTSTAAPYSEIWVIPAGGGTAVQETSNPASADARPSWSPDGAKIAFTNGTGSILQVHVVIYNPTGLGTGQTALTSGATNELPDWCCDAAP